MPNLTVTKNYSDGTVLTEQELDDAFQSIESFINDTGIGEDNMQSGSVGSSQLQAASVTTAKIAASAVTTDKIDDASITIAKLAAAVAEKFLPSATVLSYAGPTAPTGFLICDGSAVNRNTYATLFNIIGTTHGVGDGSTTFNIPDYRGRFLRGVDNGAGRDPDAGTRTAMNASGNVADNVGSIQDEGVKAHTHPIFSFANAGLSASGGNDVAVLNNSAGTGGSNIAASSGSETRPKNANVFFIIKT